MANGKKSFVLYTDQIHIAKKLTREYRGDLFELILDYVNDKNPDENKYDLAVQIAFENIKQQLKRDLIKYENTRERNVENANKRWHKENATASDRIRPHTKNAVNVNDNVNDNVINKYIKPDENYILDLPENKINSAIEYLTLTKNIKASRDLINSLWIVFKQKNFTGENSYKSESKIFTHFFESLKFEQINGSHQETLGNKGKQGTSEARTEALKNW